MVLAVLVAFPGKHLIASFRELLNASLGASPILVISVAIYISTFSTLPLNRERQ